MRKIIIKIRVSKGSEEGERGMKLKEGLELRGYPGIIFVT